MTRCFVLLCFAFLLLGCDDGDIITVELTFDGNLLLCDNNTENYVIYEVITDPNESLSLVFPRNSNDSLIFDPPEIPYTTTLTIDGTTRLFNYRTYNQEPTFCTTLPDPNLVITDDFPADTGTVDVTTVIVDSDDDGISNEDENEADNQDTDGDGIPDYIDQDDDNDNIPTRNEDDNTDGDDNPFTNPKDTDGDGIADYLEEDDDDDGVLTRLEDENGNTNPIDDFEELSTTPSTPRYLDDTATEAFPDSGLISNEFIRTITITFVVNDVDLGVINYDVYNLGTYTNSETIQSEDD
ncbi:MAG: hypothetical protein AAF901_09055 [Bacteroidota bacterium]